MVTMPKAMIAAVAIAAAAAVPATARGDAQEFFEVRADRGVPRIFRNGAPMPSRVFFGSFLHGGFPKSWEAVPRQFSYALDAGVPVSNYGLAIAYMNGIFHRSLQIFRDNEQ